MNFDILNSKTATLSELHTALDALPSQADAERVVDDLEAQRRAALLTGSDSDVAAIEKKITAANRTVERIAVARGELERRIDEAQVSAQATQRRLKAKAADKLANDAAALVVSTMEKIAPLILEMLKAVAEADQAVDAANRLRAPGEPALSGPEDRVRTRPSLPERIVSQKRVTRWVFERDGGILGVEHYGRVQESPREPGVGVIQTQSGLHRLRRRHFTEQTILPELRGGAHPMPLARAFALPALANPSALWTPVEPWISHAEIIRRAEDALAALGADDTDPRWPQVRLVPINDEVNA